MKIKNQSILGNQEYELCNNNSNGGFLPIGSIIPIIIGKIPSDSWHLCDGSQIEIKKIDGNIQLIDIPDLMNDIFLCGSNSSPNTFGGYNGDHIHSIIYTSTISNGSRSIHYHTDSVNRHRYSGFKGLSGGGNYDAVYPNSNIASGNPSGVPNHVHPYHFKINSNIIGSGFQNDNNQESNMPKYFTINYWIRIK